MKHLEYGQTGNFFLGVLQRHSPGAIDVKKVAVWPDTLNQVGGVLEQITVLFLTPAQLLLGLPAASALFGLLQGAADGRDQPRQPVLEHVVGRAGF